MHRHPQGGVVPLCARWKGQTFLPLETETRPSVGCFALINSALCVAKFWNSASARKRHCKTFRIQFASPPQYVQQTWMCNTHIHESGFTFRRLQQMGPRPFSFSVWNLAGCLATGCKLIDRFARNFCDWPVMFESDLRIEDSVESEQNSAESSSFREKRVQEQPCFSHWNVKL